MSDPGATDDEEWVLTTPEGRALLALVDAVREPGAAELERWRRQAAAGRVSAAVRIAETRRRGASKFARAGAMWFTAAGLEQATAEPVALAKARRFPGGTIADICAGIGGDAIALAGRGHVVALDRDPGMGRRLRWNAGVHGVADRVLPVTAEAERVPLPPGAWVHVDPDRRSGRPRGGRARLLEGYRPSLAVLRALVGDAPGGAIKLGPASDFDDAFGGPGFEIELVSLRGECKEATAWFGDARTCRRRATCLPAGATWTDRDGLAAPRPAGPVLDWVFDPDPALVRAGLLDGFAAAHDLRRAAEGADLLTGPSPVESPFLATFRVVAVASPDLKALRREVAALGIGPLEVKTKGSCPSPEVVRARLRPRGDRPATLILLGGRSPGLAILATRPGAGQGGV